MCHKLNSTLSDKSAFTLIELSIVLVIIGLIVGGVLVGQDLITAARVRKDISTIEELNVAVNTFLGKYDCLPGDCANFSTFFATAAAGAYNGFGKGAGNGNGDGLITGYSTSAYGDLGWVFDPYTSDYYYKETALFYIHLTNAGMIPLPAFTGTNPPCVAGVNTLAMISAAQNGSLVPYSYNGQNFYMLTYSSNCISGNMTGFSADVAARLDTKIDDGLPLTGNFQDAQAPNWWNGSSTMLYPGCEPPESGSNGFVNSSGVDIGWQNIYNRQGKLLGWVTPSAGPCALRMIAPW